MPETASTGGIKVDTLYTEMELRAQGVEAGAAKVKASLKEVDVAAERTQRNLDKIGSRNPNNLPLIEDGKKQALALIELGDAFRAGKITQDEYEKGVIALGGKIKVATALQKERAAAFVAEGAAAKASAAGTVAAGVAAEGAAVGFRSLLATLGPFAVAMIGVELGSKLVRIAWEALTNPGKNAREVIEEVTEALRKQREEAFKASQQGLETQIIRASIAKGEAERQLAEAQRGRTVTTGSLGRGGTRQIVDPAEVERARALVDEMDANLRQAESNLKSFEGKAESARASAIGRALEAGAKNNALVAEATALTKKYNDELTKLLSSDKLTDAQLARVNDLQDLIETLTAADRKAQKTSENAAQAAERLRSAQANARNAFASATAGFTLGKADDFETQIAKLTGQAIKAKLSADEIRKLVGDLRSARNASIARDQEAIKADIAELAARSTITAVDDLNLALENLKKSMREKGASEELIAQVEAIQRPVIDATATVEALGDAVERIQRDTQAGFNLRANLDELEQLIDKTIEARDKAPAGSTALATLQKEVDRLLAIEVQLREKIRQLQKDAAAHANSIRENVAGLAGGIASAANAAFGLASAFLGVDSNVTKALGSIGQLAGGIQSALKATSLLGALPGIGQAIGGGLALANTLFGESPAERERAARTKENTEALRKLTERVGTLAQITATGNEIRSATGALSQANLTDEQLRDRLRARFGNRGFSGIASNPQALAGATNEERRRALDDAIRAAGLSLEQFKQIMAGLGISLSDTSLTAEELNVALKVVNDAAAAKFGESFAGQMEEFNAAVDVFDLSDPIKQFERFRQALENVSSAGKKGAGALSTLLKDFDLTTAEGITAAEKALQDLFAKFEAGTLTADDLGGLSQSEFIDALLKALGIIRAARGDTAAAGTGGFNVSREITEVTGNRMAALLSTGNVFSEQTARNTALIAQLLGGSPVTGPVAPPSIERTGFNSGNAPVVYATVQNYFSGSVADTEQVGQKIGDATIRAIDKELGSRAKWTRRAVGDATRT